jgi:hypothetical protein
VRNWQCNSDATAAKSACNFTTQNLTHSCNSQDGISLQVLREFLSEDWEDYKGHPKALELWTDLLFKSQLMQQGIVPDNFTATTHYNFCGYVQVPPALANNGSVLGCPWYWHRTSRLVTPKSSFVNPITT